MSFLPNVIYLFISVREIGTNYITQPHVTSDHDRVKQITTRVLNERTVRIVEFTYLYRILVTGSKAVVCGAGQDDRLTDL